MTGPCCGIGYAGRKKAVTKQQSNYGAMSNWNIQNYASQNSQAYYYANAAICIK